MKIETEILDEQVDGQRLDNFLITRLKGVPHSRIYRAIRKGEVRINKKRVRVDYRIKTGDELRLPPLRVAKRTSEVSHPSQKALALETRILYEDDDLIIMSKPAGMAVHGGSGVTAGLIELLRTIRPHSKRLELVHRLDRDTSGCLLIAKKRRLLIELHELLLHKRVRKQYLALVKGHFPTEPKKVVAPLLKNVLKSGERMVTVHDAGKAAITHFRLIHQFRTAALVEAIPLTGRTHQIRVHAAFLGHPIALDEKYGDPTFNQTIKKLGLRRLFLHAAGIQVYLKSKNRAIGICAVLEPDLRQCLDKLNNNGYHWH